MTQLSSPLDYTYHGSLVTFAAGIGDIYSKPRHGGSFAAVIHPSLLAAVRERVCEKYK